VLFIRKGELKIESSHSI